MAVTVRGYRCDDPTYEAIKEAAWKARLPISDWVVKTLREALSTAPNDPDTSD